MLELAKLPEAGLLTREELEVAKRQALGLAANEQEQAKMEQTMPVAQATPQRTAISDLVARNPREA